MTASRGPAWVVAAAVPDPELPVVTIADLGILREVTEDSGGHVTVRVTPTYSGCPAMAAIRADLVDRLTKAGYREVEVEQVLSPAWTTDDITDAGRAKLLAAGITPPATAENRSVGGPGVACPRCGSTRTRELSRFGATTCTSLRVCGDCAEPFQQFRVLV